MRRPKNLKLKYLWRKSYSVMCEGCFPIVFLWNWRSKDSVVLKFERCEQRDDIAIADGDQEDVKCQMFFYCKTK